MLYDLYGRGYSDAVEGNGEYDTTLYTTQLALLMQRVGWNKAGVVGVSMVSPLWFSCFCTLVLALLSSVVPIYTMPSRSDFDTALTYLHLLISSSSPLMRVPNTSHSYPAITVPPFNVLRDAI